LGRFIFLLLVLLSACQKPQIVSHSGILNCDSLLNAQLAGLTSMTLEKKLSVNGVEFQSTTTGKIDWAKELEAFRELNQINRPIYRDAYQIKNTPDPQSNLTIQIWTAKTKVPIRTLRLFYLEKLNNIKRMEAEIEFNEFYHRSSKTMRLDFALLGHPRLESYEISGSQQYFWGASNSILVEGSIRP
jgi:hypothetical protein